MKITLKRAPVQVIDGEHSEKLLNQDIECEISDADIIRIGLRYQEIYAQYMEYKTKLWPNEFMSFESWCKATIGGFNE